jgi:2-iminobutanoate/2-iminopropanoate deaminase
MKKDIIKTDKAPKAIGPYEQAIRIDNLIFTSGQIPIDPKTNTIVKGDIRTQAQRVFENLKGVVESCGSSLENVIKVTIYLENLNDFEEMNRIYEEYFGKSKPARSCVEVSALPKGVAIEADLIATVE